MDRRGLLIILSSPSGAGKSTLSRRMLEWDPSLSFSVSATTRAPRPGEVDGRDYHFDRAQFKAMVADGEMLEHAHVFGNFYGSPRWRRWPRPLKPAATCCSTSTGRARSRSEIRRSGKHTLSIFMLPPSIAELERRLETARARTAPR